MLDLIMDTAGALLAAWLSLTMLRAPVLNCVQFETHSCCAWLHGGHSHMAAFW